MTVEQVADRTKLSGETIAHYGRLGILSRRRALHGRRLAYGSDSVERVEMILVLQAKGWPLKDIAKLFVKNPRVTREEVERMGPKRGPKRIRPVPPSDEGAKTIPYGEVLERAGVNRSFMSQCQQHGIVRYARLRGGTSHYFEETVERLRDAKRLRATGATWGEINDILKGKKEERDIGVLISRRELIEKTQVSEELFSQCLAQRLIRHELRRPLKAGHYKSTTFYPMEAIDTLLKVKSLRKKGLTWKEVRRVIEGRKVWPRGEAKGEERGSSLIPMTTFSVCLEDSSAKRVKEIAMSEECGNSQVIRELVADGLRARNGGPSHPEPEEDELQSLKEEIEALKARVGKKRGWKGWIRCLGGSDAT